MKTIRKKIIVLLIGIFLPLFVFACIYNERRDDFIPSTVDEKWFVCPYTKLINEQSAVYKSMEHVNWISIEKIHGKGSYCLEGGGGGVCASSENPGILQKIDLWRQRLKKYQNGEELRTYYDSQRNPRNPIDDRYDEDRWALLSWLTDTREKAKECITGYGAPYKENLAEQKLYGCREGVTATSSQSFRITPDFPYPVHINRSDSEGKDLNCFPYNAEYLTKAEKKQCAENKDRTSGCLMGLNNPRSPYASDAIYKTSLDDFYCTYGREQTAK
jgi:hypothetical protein